MFWQAPWLQLSSLGCCASVLAGCGANIAGATLRGLARLSGGFHGTLCRR